MAMGRVLGSLASVAAVAGCAFVAVSMSRASSVPTAADSQPAPVSSVTESVYSYRAPVPVASSTRAAPSTTVPMTTTAVTHAAAPPPATLPATAPVAPAATTHAVAPKPATRPTTTSTHAVAPKPALRRGVHLPLGYGTGSATRVITVTAGSAHTTTARLQAWTKAPGGGWLKHGSSVLAHVGSDGLTNSMSEFVSATPMGSFTLTQAFGRLSNPGTPLPYFRTTPADWWISQTGSRYNTHQRCTNSSTNCGYHSPSEHLYYETPYYNYAVVIDYNTRNTGHVVQNGGSAVFLHVTDGQPTAGCVAIAQSRLVPLMRWLAPSTHPRILIGVT